MLYVFIFVTLWVAFGTVGYITASFAAEAKDQRLMGIAGGLLVMSIVSFCCLWASVVLILLRAVNGG